MSAHKFMFAVSQENSGKEGVFNFKRKKKERKAGKGRTVAVNNNSD